MTPDRLPGLLVTVDGPGGAGKTTLVHTLTGLLVDAELPVHATRQPSTAELGKIARHGTDTYAGMALAALCAADRHHQLAIEILPALHAGHVVLCDRYVASSIVLQGLDGIPADIVLALNHGVHVPDLAIILTADPALIDSRLRGRGGPHSRFERDPDNAQHESLGCQTAATVLTSHGWPVHLQDCTSGPDTVAASLASRIHDLLATRKEPACP